MPRANAAIRAKYTVAANAPLQGFYKGITFDLVKGELRTADRLMQAGWPFIKVKVVRKKKEE